MEQGRHRDAGAAYRVCQLPEPTDCRAAAAERQARHKRCAGGGGHLAHDRHHGTGKAAPVAFTQQELGWEPWIAAKPLADFRDDEVAILAKFGHTDSDYFRLLGRNLPVLEQRTLTDKGIFYTPGDCRAPSASWPQRSPVKSTAAFTAHLSMRVKPASCQRMTRR
jgi:hypothetical protein